MDEARKLYLARRRVEAITGFYIHLGVYLIVNAGLFLVNLFTGPDWWVQWPVVGWGIGLIAHGAVVYGVTHPRVIDWEERKVEELAGRGG
ncbi:MAG: 2TM domain-containing protein [Hyphomicrobiaceae bacterium]